MLAALVIVPFMLLVIGAVAVLAGVLAYPYRKERVPQSVPGSERLDKALTAVAHNLAIIDPEGPSKR